LRNFGNRRLKSLRWPPIEKQYPAQDTDFPESADTNIPTMLSTLKTCIVHLYAVDAGATITCESEELMEPFLQEKVWSVRNGIPAVFEALGVELPAGHPHSELKCKSRSDSGLPGIYGYGSIEASETIP
jgi:hypothetical protein